MSGSKDHTVNKRPALWRGVVARLMVFAVLLFIVAPLPAAADISQQNAWSTMIGVSNDTADRSADELPGPGLIQHVLCSCHTAVWRQDETVAIIPVASSIRYSIQPGVHIRLDQGSLPFKPPRA
jgi:hypothetical protein